METSPSAPSVIDRSCRQTISKDTDDLKSTINQFDLIDMYKIFHAVPSADLAYDPKRELKCVAAPKHWMN